jgi:hypothetical protein
LTDKSLDASLAILAESSIRLLIFEIALQLGLLIPAGISDIVTL